MWPAAKSSTGWMLFRRLRSVKPKAVSSTHYFSGDLSGILFNPSLLGSIESKEYDFTASLGIADERIAGFMHAFPYNDTTSLALGIFNYDYGKISLNWIENDVMHERIVKAQSDYMGIVSWGRNINENLDYGLAFKMARSQVAETASAHAFSFDAAASLYIIEGLALTAAAQNFGLSTKFVEKNEKLPSSLMFGASILSKAALGYVLLAYESPYLVGENRFLPGMGVEMGIWPFSIFAGYRTYADEAALCFGAGFATDGYDFSYSYTPSKWLDDVHRISVALKPGRKEDARKQIKRAFSEGISEFEEKTRRQKALERKRIKKQMNLKPANLKPAKLSHEGIYNEMYYGIKLIKDSVIFPGAGYFIEGIIDSRAHKDDIGTIKSGVKQLPVMLEGGMAQSLFQFFEHALPKQRDSVPVILNVTVLRVTTGPDKLRADVKVEFLLKKLDELGKLYSTKAAIEKQTDPLQQPLLESMVREALIKCLDAFSEFNWADAKVKFSKMPELIDDIQTVDRTDAWIKPEPQIYSSRFGLGHGVPYGGTGIGFEFHLGDYSSLAFGTGSFGGKPGATMGARLYLVPRARLIRPRFSLHYGTVKSGEKKNISGNAFAFGLGLGHSKLSVDFDVIYIRLPSDYEQSIEVKGSCGLGLHF